MKIVFVCDWLTGMRGGERCLEIVCEIYPDADIFTLVHLPGSVSKTIESHTIHTSYIQKLPGDINKFRQYLPLFSHAIEKFDFTGYDCVLSFSHCVAKNVKVPKNIPHICYCHTPMRYAWHMRNDYLKSLNFIKRIPAAFLLDWLKKYDKSTAARVTHFIANSKNVQNRIKQAYNADSVVIYPPVDCERFAVSAQDDGYFLVVSALVPYKRLDIAIKAFNDTTRKLLVVGNGPELQKLKNLASNNISFVENAGDREVVGYMQRCTALIFPGEEDFGIVPLEAQACGKPVIAFGKGGALETIIGLKDGITKVEDATGIFFNQQTPGALKEAVSLFEKVKGRFDAQKCRANALKFDRPLYKKTIREYVQNVMGGLT